VCAHRLVNAYSRTDWVLALVYRSASFSRNVAGLQPVPVPPVPPDAVTACTLENLDVTHLVTSHWCPYTWRSTRVQKEGDYWEG
jgi:hypothetical protein